MVNWEDELRRSIVKQLGLMGCELPADNIKIVDVDVQVNDEFLKLLNITELGTIYAYTIMQEKFEQAEIIKKLLAERDCKVEFDVDDKTMTGVLDIFVKPPKTLEHIVIDMIITPDGFMVDFDKE